MQKKRIVLGVSGASGAPLAWRLLKKLAQTDEVDTNLVMTAGGERTVEEECDITVQQFKALANAVYDNRDIGAAIASGTFPVQGMIVLPCSMKTAAGIAHGYSDNLLLRAADVAIKEQRKLILVPRESPLSRIHLDNLAYLASLPGVQIMPPVLSYYHRPKSLEDVEEQLVGRILAKFEIFSAGLKQWKND